MRKSVIILFALLFLSIPIYSFGGTTTFKVMWDPNTEADLVGYRVYMDNEQLSPDIPCMAHNGTCCNWTSGPIPMGDHVLHATAFDIYGNESEPSNILTFTSGLIDLVSPDPPKNFIIQVFVTGD